MDARHNIVLSSAVWRQAIIFAPVPAANALSYASLTRNVFLRGGDRRLERLVSRADGPVPAPRTLAYYAAHEIAHSLTHEAVGRTVYNAELPVWVREGLADYVALGAGTARRMVAGQNYETVRTAHERRLYLGYHLLVACAVETQALGLNDLMSERQGYAAAFEARVSGDLTCRTHPHPHPA